MIASTMRLAKKKKKLFEVKPRCLQDDLLLVSSCVARDQARGRVDDLSLFQVPDIPKRTEALYTSYRLPMISVGTKHLGARIRDK